MLFDFYVIRFIFSLGSAFVIFYLARRNRYRVRISLLAFVMIFTALCFLSFEKKSITFDSIEDAHRYSDSKGNSIELVINGEKSDMVVTKDKDSNYFTVYPKYGEVWYMGSAVDQKCVLFKTIDRLIVRVYTHKDVEEDFYVIISSLDGNIVSISDSENSEFIFWDDGSFVEGLYFARIEAFNDNYLICVNGKEYKVK